MSEDKSIGRKGFLELVTWAVGGLISLAMGIPAVAYIIGPAVQKGEEQDWIRLGSTTKVEMGTPTLFKTTIQRQNGWMVNEEEISAFILTEDDRDYVALSNICTHLGCRVRWIEGQEQFFCPCHNAVFDKEGEVVSGPPPRPLDQFQVKVEENQLYIQGE